MDVNETVQAAFNGMIAMMLAKFMSNDMPHTLGITSNEYPWVSLAWQELCAYSNAHSVNLQAAYNRFIAVQHKLGVEYPYLDTEDVLQYLPPRSKRATDTRVLLSGYWLIANGEASDKVVDDVHFLLKYYEHGSRLAYEKIMSETYEDYAGEVADMAILDFLPVRNAIREATARTEKVLATDSFMHYTHLGYAMPAEAFSIAEMFMLHDEDDEPYFNAIWKILEALSK